MSVGSTKSAGTALCTHPGATYILYIYKSHVCILSQPRPFRHLSLRFFPLFPFILFFLSSFHFPSFFIVSLRPASSTSSHLFQLLFSFPALTYAQHFFVIFRSLEGHESKRTATRCGDAFIRHVPEHCVRNTQWVILTRIRIFGLNSHHFTNNSDRCCWCFDGEIYHFSAFEKKLRSFFRINEFRGNIIVVLLYSTNRSQCISIFTIFVTKNFGKCNICHSFLGKYSFGQ